MNPSINRRHFLKSSSLLAGAVALPQIIPSRLLGADGQTAPSNQITVGCIGVGGMGTINLRNFLGLSRAKVVAVCDVSEEKREKAKKLVDEKYGDNGWIL